jgi:two-component system, response regulator
MIREQVILLVEDTDNDAELTVMALRRANIANEIVRVEDGRQALDYLFTAARPNGPLPAVVILDINLPRLNGLEVLKAIRSDERTAWLPVVILTSSVEDRDRLAAYQHRANSYLQKPVHFNDFAAAVRQLGLHWLVLNVEAPAHMS